MATMAARPGIGLSLLGQPASDDAAGKTVEHIFCDEQSDQPPIDEARNCVAGRGRRAKGAMSGSNWQNNRAGARVARRRGMILGTIGGHRLRSVRRPERHDSTKV
jgi:hypothetical protein